MQAAVSCALAVLRIHMVTWAFSMGRENRHLHSGPLGCQRGRAWVEHSGTSRRRRAVAYLGRTEAPLARSAFQADTNGGTGLNLGAWKPVWKVARMEIAGWIGLQRSAWHGESRGRRPKPAVVATHRIATQRGAVRTEDGATAPLASSRPSLELGSGSPAVIRQHHLAGIRIAKPRPTRCWVSACQLSWGRL